MGEHAEGEPAARRKKQGLPGGLTGNALITGVYLRPALRTDLVLHRPVAGPGRGHAGRISAAGHGSHPTAGSRQHVLPRNDHIPGQLLLLETQPVPRDGAIDSPWATYQEAFNAARANMSDPQAARLAVQADYDGAAAIKGAGENVNSALPWFHKMVVAYQQLIALRAARALGPGF